MTFKQSPVLFGLIGLNVAIFLMQTAGFDWRDIGALWLPESPFYHHWQWLTHQFLHKDLLHIVLNMYALGLFGAPLLRLWGSKRFLLLYLISGVAAAALYTAYQTYLLYQLNPYTTSPTEIAQIEQWLFSPMLGASGAVFGVLAAFAVRLPQIKLGLMLIPIQLPARWFVGIIVIYELFAQLSGISLFGNHIAHLAHVGGAIAGGLLGTWYVRQEPQQML